MIRLPIGVRRQSAVPLSRSVLKWSSGFVRQKTGDGRSHKRSEKLFPAQAALSSTKSLLQKLPTMAH